MSVELMPRWQRQLVAWFINRQARKASVKIHCPSCKAIVPTIRLHPDLLWEVVLECAQCGHLSSLSSFIAPATQTEEERFAETEEPVSQPTGTRILVEDDGSVRRWQVPAKGGCNFLLVFSAAWLAFFVFVGVVASGSDESYRGSMVIILAFILIGLAMLYFGLQISRARHTLELDAAELVHTRYFGGRPTRKTFTRESIRSVKLVVFYEQNYKPIHGIEIIGERRKIRFGSALTPEEKAWLCQDLRHALGLAQSPPETAHSSSNDNAEKAGGKLVMERGAGHAVIQSQSRSFGTFLLIFGTIFVSVAGFMLWGGARMWMPWEEDAVPFFLIFNGFVLFWCLGVSTFLLIGLSTLMFGWRMRRTTKMLHADQQTLTLIATCGSRVVKHAWKVEDVQQMRVESWAKVNGVPMYHGVVLLRERAVTFGTGARRPELQQALAMLSEVMGRDDLLTTKSVAA